jgi:hypothetical protein
MNEYIVAAYQGAGFLPKFHVPSHGHALTAPRHSARFHDERIGLMIPRRRLVTFSLNIAPSMLKILELPRFRRRVVA